MDPFPSPVKWQVLFIPLVILLLATLLLNKKSPKVITRGMVKAINWLSDSSKYPKVHFYLKIQILT